MSSGKSVRLIQEYYNYNQKNADAWAIKPATDRTQEPKIISRTGLECPATIMKEIKWEDIIRMKEFYSKVFLIDEVQFFKPSDIEKLVQIADSSKITIFCYGLKLDSNGDLFPASAKLLSEADEIHQMETVCEIPRCTSMASHHIRFDKSGNIIRCGNQVEVGASQYKSVCRKHFHQLYDGKIHLNQLLQRSSR